MTPRALPAWQVLQLCSSELGLAPLLAGSVLVAAPDAVRKRRASARGARAVGLSAVEAGAGAREAADETDAMVEALRALGVPLLAVDNDSDNEMDDDSVRGVDDCVGGSAGSVARVPGARAVALVSTWPVLN